MKDQFDDAFADLVPASRPDADFDAAFADLIPAAGAKRQVGAGEALWRGAKRSIGSFAESMYSIPAAATIPFDAISAALGLTEPGAITNPVAETFVDPLRRMREQGTIDRNKEQIGLGGEIAYGGGQLLGMAPEIMAGRGPAGLARETELAIANITRGQAPKLVGEVGQIARPELIAGVPSAASQSSQRANELRAQGVDPLRAGGAGAVDAATTMLGFAAPVSAAGGIVRRAVTGGAGNIAIDAGSRASENLILPPSAQQDLSVADITTSGGLGAVLAAMMGQRRAPSPMEAGAIARSDVDAMRARAGQEAADIVSGQVNPGAGLTLSDLLYGTTRAPDLAPTPEPGAITMPEPRTARQAASSFTAEGVPVFRREDFVVDPAGQELIPLADAPRMAQDTLPTTGQTTGTVATDVERMAAEREAARQYADGTTRGAFDVAGATPPEPGDATMGQRKRKQDAVDAPGLTGGPQRDLRDASAGGTTSEEGTAATSPEAFTFLDVKRNKDGRVTSTGPQVEILQRGLFVSGKDGKQEPAVMVGYDDAEGNSRTSVVPESRLGTLERPASPRFAQDVAASTYRPPRGTGTGPDQPEPIEAAQRITTRPGAELIQADEPQPTQRSPETFDQQPDALPAPLPPRLPQPETPQPPMGYRGQSAPAWTAPERSQAPLPKQPEAPPAQAAKPIEAQEPKRRPEPDQPKQRLAPESISAEALDGKPIAYESNIGGKRVRVSHRDAGSALRRMDGRIDSLKKLLDCLAR